MPENPENDEFTIEPTPVPVPATPEVEGDPLYQRQVSFGLAQPTVSLVGCGGVGCWVALALALGGVSRLDLYDGDTLSLHNFNRFPLPPGVVGEMKSLALARWLATLRPEIEINARGEFQAGVQVMETNWIVCATDSLKSRVECFKEAQKLNSRYLEVGAEGEGWSLSPVPPEFSTSLEDQAGYQTVPVHVGPCMMAGAAAAYYVLHNQNPCYSLSMNWKKGPVLRARINGGKGRYDKLEFREIEETKPDLDGVDLLDCRYCKGKVEVDIIILIRHIREHNPSWGLVQGKVEAEKWYREYYAFTTVPIQAEATLALATQEATQAEPEAEPEWGGPSEPEFIDVDMDTVPEEAANEQEE